METKTDSYDFNINNNSVLHSQFFCITLFYLHMFNWALKTLSGTNSVVSFYYLLKINVLNCKKYKNVLSIIISVHEFLLDF